ncbi:MAG: hypothetical protein IKZ82_01415 [Clostridia bacterium]|nr:hypothetical protein [Clostridia bacterium]
MKNYSEMTNSVLKRAAEIREEQHEKARKTRKSLTALGCAAVMLALAVGAVLLIKPFGARGDGPYAQDAKNTADAIKSSPEPTPRGSNSPSFITETTRVKSYEEGDKLNTELAVSMLTEEGYIHFEYGMMRRKCYSGDDPVLRNCTPNYVRKHSSDIELFVLAPDTSVDYNRYFIRLGDTLYRYEPNNLGYDYNYMCLWDHDNNGVDDIVLLSTAFPGSCFMTDIFDVSTKTVKQILTRDMIRFPVFSFQFDGTSIYLDQNKVDYIDGEFYLGGVKADESVLGSAAVKRYEDGDGLNTNRALELLRSDGYIDIRTGEVHFDYYNISYVALRNCTPSYIRERSEDIELFQDSTGMCFVRLGDKLYNSYGAWHICMCLWDHDGNGVDDLVFISNWGSGNTHLAASVFDLSTKSHRKILSLSAHSDPPFRFDFDGESIYIDGLKVECANGKFFIGGMDADEYALMKLYSAESHENTPEPTPSGEPEPIFITDKTALYYDDDTASLNVELVLSMLKTDGYIDGYDGVKRKDSEPSIEICNCTPEYFRKNFPDIELFVDMKQDDRSEYIIRYGDKLYRFDFEKGRHHNMCLWDYDGNGVDDLVFYSSTWSSEAIAYQRIDCIDVCKDQLKLILHRRADFPSCIISFDYDGKNVYVDKLKLDFWAEAAYIDGRMADSYLPEFETEHELIPFKSIFVKEYADGSTFNTARACSIIEDSGFILEDGSRITDFNTASLQLYNCTSYDVAWKTSDIELFYNNPHDWPAYFLRIGDELYRCDAFGGHHIFMCLWDYDKNGVDDVVLVSECGSGTTIHKAVVFDVCNKSWKTIISRNIMCEDGFTFHFDGENIYIHFKKRSTRTENS